MYMSFIFQSRDLFGIVSDTHQKLESLSDAEKAIWNKKDKATVVAILSAIDNFHK